MSVPNPMPSACTPIRLISVSNSQRASYSRKPVALTIGSDSYAYVLGDSAGFGAGNIGASDRRCRRKAHSPAAARPQSLEYRVPPAKAHGLTIYSRPTLLGPYDVTNYDPTFTAVFTNKTDCALSRRRAPAWRLGHGGVARRRTHDVKIDRVEIRPAQPGIGRYEGGRVRVQGRRHRGWHWHPVGHFTSFDPIVPNQVGVRCVTGDRAGPRTW